MKFPRTWDLIFTNKVSRKKKESNSYPSKSLQSVFKTGIGICVFQKKTLPNEIQPKPTNEHPPPQKKTNQPNNQTKKKPTNKKTKQSKTKSRIKTTKILLK